MDKDLDNNHGTNLVGLVNKLAEAKKAIPYSKEKIKDRPKSAEGYLICKDGTLAETDHSDLANDQVILKETKE